MNTDDSKDYKKSIFNKLTYGINKRLLSYEDKIDNILDKLNNTNNINNIDNANNTNNIDNSDFKKILLSINSFNEKFEILNERMINIENRLDNFFIKNDTIKNDTIKNDTIKNNTIKNDTIKNDTIKNDTIKNDIIKNDTVNCIPPKDYTINNNTIKNNIVENDNNFYKELKVETFLHLNINKDFIKECLNMSNINGDIKLFKKIYIDNILKEYYPIRHIKKKLQYWLDNHMNDDDTNGTYIKNIIFKNMETCYLKINIFDEHCDNTEQFLKNQEHINKLSEQKYKDKFLTKIIQIITI